MVDFTAFPHPVRAVSCPECGAAVGKPCKRPSGHVASHFHRSRGARADQVFISQHGEDASIEFGPGGWFIDPTGRRRARLDGRRTQ